MIGSAARFQSIEELRAALAALGSHPSHVTSGWRAAQLIATSLLPAAIVVAWLENTRIPLPERWSSVALGLALVCLAPSTILAFVLRGSLTFWLFGLQLRARPGARASRWRCAWRSLLIWLPTVSILALAGWDNRFARMGGLVLFFAVLFAIAHHVYQERRLLGSVPWPRWLLTALLAAGAMGLTMLRGALLISLLGSHSSYLVAIAGLLVPLIGGVLSALSPAHGPQDRLAGTRIVPR